MKYQCANPECGFIIPSSSIDGLNGALCPLCNSPIEQFGVENNHKYIDLGLSVKWATCNVGSSKPEDYGNYFLNNNAIVREVWGGRWRIPNKSEFHELLQDCSWTWIERNGVNGYSVISKKSDWSNNALFFPASGEGAIFVGYSGTYWTRDILIDNTSRAWALGFNNNVISLCSKDVNTRCSLRLVCSY